MAVQIQKENGETKIYEQVHERLTKFRKDCPADQGWAIITEVLSSDSQRVSLVAKILSPDGKVVATGHAEELRNSSNVNRSSAVENGETSAVGRALFMAGYGNGEICSAEELAAALRAQSQLKGRQVAPVDSGAQPSQGNPSRCTNQSQRQAKPTLAPKPTPKPQAKPQPKQAPSNGPNRRGGCFDGVNPNIVKLLANMGVDTKAMAGFDLKIEFDGKLVKISGNQTKEAKHLWAKKSFRWNGKEWWRQAA